MFSSMVGLDGRDLSVNYYSKRVMGSSIEKFILEPILKELVLYIKLSGLEEGAICFGESKGNFIVSMRDCSVKYKYNEIKDELVPIGYSGSFSKLDDSVLREIGKGFLNFIKCISKEGFCIDAIILAVPFHIEDVAIAERRGNNVEVYRLEVGI